MGRLAPFTSNDIKIAINGEQWHLNQMGYLSLEALKKIIDKQIDMLGYDAGYEVCGLCDLPVGKEFYITHEGRAICASCEVTLRTGRRTHPRFSFPKS